MDDATPMTDTTAPQAGNTEPATVTPADLAAQTPTPEPAAEVAEPATTEQPESPAFDREYVEKLRKEAASYRTRAKELEESKTAELDAFKQEMAKALGLVEDATDDPAKLLEAATKREQEIQAERDKYAAQITEYRQRDAIRTAVDKAGVTDPALLEAVLKSNNAFNQLDIDADDYTAQVAQLVTETVQQHPALAQVAPTASGVDTSTTNTGASQKITREQLANMTSEEINKAAREGKLAHLMNQ